MSDAFGVVVIVGMLVTAVFWVLNEIGAKIESDEKRESEHAYTQLIGGERFLEDYKTLLEQLRKNESFMQFVRSLHTELNGEELTNTAEANRKIANEFYYRKINDMYPEVKQIATAVRKFGTQASAHISIYYAMFIVEE